MKSMNFSFSRMWREMMMYDSLELSLNHLNCIMMKVIIIWHHKGNQSPKALLDFEKKKTSLLLYCFEKLKSCQNQIKIMMKNLTMSLQKYWPYDVVIKYSSLLCVVYMCTGVFVLGGVIAVY